MPNAVTRPEEQTLSIIQIVAAGLVEDFKRAGNLESIPKRAALFFGVAALLFASVLPSDGIAGYNAVWLKFIGWICIIAAYCMQVRKDSDSVERALSFVYLLIAVNYLFYGTKWWLLGSISSGNLVEICMFAFGLFLGGSSMRILHYQTFSIIGLSLTVIYSILAFVYLYSSPFNVGWPDDAFNFDVHFWSWSSTKGFWVAVLFNLVTIYIAAMMHATADERITSPQPFSINPPVANSRWATPREKSFRKILED